MVNDVNKNLKEEKTLIDQKQILIEEKLKLQEENRIKDLEFTKNKVIQEADHRNNLLLEEIRNLKAELNSEKKADAEKILIQNEEIFNLKNVIAELRVGVSEVEIFGRGFKFPVRGILKPKSTKISALFPSENNLNNVDKKIDENSNKNREEFARMAASQVISRDPPTVQPRAASKSPERSLRSSSEYTPVNSAEKFQNPPVSHHSPEQPAASQKIEKINLGSKLEAPVSQPEPVRQPEANSRPPKINRQDFINQLETRLKDLNLDLSMSTLTTQDYIQKSEFLKQQRLQNSRNFMNYYQTRQLHSNRLESETVIRSRNNSSSNLNQNSNSGNFTSPTRQKSLSTQNLNETYSSILKKSGSRASNTALPRSATNLVYTAASKPPSGSLSNLNARSEQNLQRKIVLEEQNMDRTRTDTPPLENNNSY